MYLDFYDLLCDLEAQSQWRRLQQLPMLPLSTKYTTKKIIKTDHIDLHVLPIARRSMQDANPNVP